jgi:hypothetical protein
MAMMAMMAMLPALRARAVGVMRAASPMPHLMAVLTGLRAGAGFLHAGAGTIAAAGSCRLCQKQWRGGE